MPRNPGEDGSCPHASLTGASGAASARQCTLSVCNPVSRHATPGSGGASSYKVNAGGGSHYESVTGYLPDDLQRGTSSNKMAAPCVIRKAEPRDIDSIQQIYAWYVQHSIATFEEAAPDVPEMLARFQAITTAGYPYIVAERHDGDGGGSGEIIGYAYVSTYRPRSAYRFTVEDAIYLRQGMAGQGVGSRLLGELVRQCEAAGTWRQMLAVVGNSSNTASIAVHRKAGFEFVGTLSAVGFKHGQWVDTVLLQRALNGAPERLTTP